MKIKLKSETFKSIYNNEEVDTKELEECNLCFSDDSNLNRLRDKTEQKNALIDYENIIEGAKTIKKSMFYELPESVLLEALRFKTFAKELLLNSMEINIDILRDIDLHDVKKLMLFSIKSKDNLKHEFKNISQMQDLEEISINNVEGISIDQLFSDIPNPQKIKSISLGSQLPSSEKLSDLINLENISIYNIKDSKELEKFLEIIPLNKIKSLSFSECDLSNFDERLIKRLENIESLTLLNNTVANYNEILDSLPNKERLKCFTAKAFRDPQTEGYYFSEKLLKPYINLDNLSLGNLNIDFNKFHEYLITAKKLEALNIEGIFIRDLDFLKDVKSDINLSFTNTNLNLKNITPELASYFRGITYSDIGKKVSTRKQGDKYGISAEVNTNDLYSINNLLEKAGYVEKVIIEMDKNSNGINQILGFIDSKKCPNGYELLIEDCSDKNVQKLLNTNIVNNVIVADKTNDDRSILKRFTYQSDEFKKIDEKIREIVQDIPKDLPDVEKFMIIYRRLGARIRYDDGVVGENAYSKYAKENFDNCRNARNGLLRNTCVCAGYADILYNCLRAVGINSYKVSGLGGEYHQWNKVEIDGVIYNSDLTWDAPGLAQNKWHSIKYCLLGSKKFDKCHKTLFGFPQASETDFSRRELKKAWKKALEFDNIRVPTLLERIKSRFFNTRKSLPEPPPSDRLVIPIKNPSWILTEEEKREYDEKSKSIKNDDKKIKTRQFQENIK